MADQGTQKHVDIGGRLSYSDRTFGSGFGVHPQSLLKKVPGFFVFRTTGDSCKKPFDLKSALAGQKQEDHGKAESK